MTHANPEQPEALPTGRELAVMLSQGHYSMGVAVDEIRRQWQEIDHLRYRIRKLEASQAQRVPLSDAVIRDLYSEEAHWDMVAPYVIAFARSIEAAHGITQEKHG